MGALKHRGITLHRGCPLLLFLLDGLHHYPNIVFLCANRRNCQYDRCGFHVPRSRVPQKKKEEFCFGWELLRLICNGPAGLFDVGRVQPASQVVMNLTIVAGSQHRLCSVLMGAHEVSQM